MGMVLLSDEATTTTTGAGGSSTSSTSSPPPCWPPSPSKATLLKKSLSQMKTLFCKEIDSHLKKLKTPSPKKNEDPVGDEPQDESHPKKRGRWPLKDTHVVVAPHSPIIQMTASNKQGKENVSAPLPSGQRKRKRHSSSTSSNIHTLVTHGSKKYKTRKNASKKRETFKNPYPIIKAFRKSPHKFDPSRISRPDDDPLPPPPTPTKGLRKKGIKKKLDLEGGKPELPFVPVNRKANIIEGDFLSHGRQYYHVRTNGKILHGEPESEESYRWIPDLMHRQIDEFLDLNAGEKELIKLWNEHIILKPAYGSEMLFHRLQEFVEAKGALLASKGLYKNFLLHLTNLYEHEVLDQESFLQLVLKQQMVMAKMKRKPWFNQWRGWPLKRRRNKRSGPPANPALVEPSLPPPRATASWLTKNKKRRRRRKEREWPSPRVSSRHRSSVLRITSDVNVKFWGAGDYTSIKDVHQMPSLKRKFETANGDSSSSSSGNVRDAKRRKISNGGTLLNGSSSCIEVT